jgi:hypothetical protein
VPRSGLTRKAVVVGAERPLPDAVDSPLAVDVQYAQFAAAAMRPEARQDVWGPWPLRLQPHAAGGAGVELERCACMSFP